MQTYKSNRGVTYHITPTLDPDHYLVEVKGMLDNYQNLILSTDQVNRLQRWLQGEGMIQDLFPDLSASVREVIMTGIGPEAWDRMFKS